MTSEGGVTHKELNDALGRQTAIIVANINRTEDSLKEDINEVKSDVEDDIQAVSERVAHIERRSRTENIIASVLAFFGSIAFFKYGGG